MAFQTPQSVQSGFNAQDIMKLLDQFQSQNKPLPAQMPQQQSVGGGVNPLQALSIAQKITGAGGGGGAAAAAPASGGAAGAAGAAGAGAAGGMTGVAAAPSGIAGAGAGAGSAGLGGLAAGGAVAAPILFAALFAANDMLKKDKKRTAAGGKESGNFYLKILESLGIK